MRRSEPEGPETIARLRDRHRCAADDRLRRYPVDLAAAAQVGFPTRLVISSTLLAARDPSQTFTASSQRSGLGPQAERRFSRQRSRRAAVQSASRGPARHQRRECGSAVLSSGPDLQRSLGSIPDCSGTGHKAEEEHSALRFPLDVVAGRDKPGSRVFLTARPGYFLDVCHSSPSSASYLTPS
jgi:hypothetical protein